jgi:hypothetical protein
MQANTPNHIDMQVTTADYIDLQTAAMWDAYARTVELDYIVDMDKLVDYIDLYLNTVERRVGLLAVQVAQSVMEAYLTARYAAIKH